MLILTIPSIMGVIFLTKTLVSIMLNAFRKHLIPII